MNDQWTDVCPMSELEPEWGEAALLDDQQVAVFRLWDDRVVITSQFDPRTGSAVMSRGLLGTRAGHPTIASPLHKECYSLITGECFTDPALQLSIHPTRIVDGIVQVRLPLDSAEVDQALEETAA
jgi:nitrite reductase (NADH) small subunit